MAEELSIGRTPIREALFRLNAENLVEAVRGRGFFVRDITLHSIKDLFETMLILERSAVALAAKRIRTDQIEDLQRINIGLGEAWHKKNYLRVTLLIALNRIIYKPRIIRFFFLLGQSATNPVFLSVLQQELLSYCFSRRAVDQRSSVH